MNKEIKSRWMIAAPRWIAAVGAVGVLAMGCGRPEEPVEPDVPEPTVPVEPRTETRERPAAPDRATAPVPAAEIDDASVPAMFPSPFRVSSIVDLGGGNVRASLISDETDRDYRVEVGDEVEGYTVIEIDSEQSRVLFTRGARTFSAHVRASPTREDAPTRAADAQPELSPGALSPDDAPRFEPTDDERRRGIDPNDPDTWPPDYRGPGIERAAQEAGAQRFEPTEDERRRGIDPNDPDTWPADYRGPGIERALQEFEQNP